METTNKNTALINGLILFSSAFVATIVVKVISKKLPQAVKQEEDKKMEEKLKQIVVEKKPPQKKKHPYGQAQPIQPQQQGGATEVKPGVSGNGHGGVKVVGKIDPRQIERAQNKKKIINRQMQALQQQLRALPKTYAGWERSKEIRNEIALLDASYRLL